ncbi:MAG TPA: hypothetical protein VM802_02015 [Chitinophaga sp.]|uniref:hypothetical protein n=1 Tax=Chitinophaga sp. TaxID=1869181 RepID=UPI002C7C8A52|nr:hypothetical protein [Chitinophaga sp.]HVI43609.1 hypothetical protein [Chitinophaga sp.]
MEGPLLYFTITGIIIKTLMTVVKIRKIRMGVPGEKVPDGRNETALAAAVEKIPTPPAEQELCI